LSATNIARLTNEWETEYRAFQKRSLADRDYVYVWVDGVHFNVRLEDDRLCTLVMIGVRPDGTKELIAVEDGYRESAESWKTVLRDLKRRGLRPPVVAVGDGALGFWAALRDVWPKTREQRDWFHKLGNILDKLPKRLQPRVKAALHEVMYAETQENAREAITRFATEYGPKYPKAVGEVWPTTREQRCWVHKTANVLGKLPKSQQPKAKRSLQEIWMAETRKDAETAFDASVSAYALKYENAAECLEKDRDALLAFYDFPAEHWKHLRTSNPIESTLATVRHRTIRSKGCLSNTTALAMVFKLVEAAQ
jgi:transposase-like protein